MSSWIGVDLDGTLAHYDHWRGLEHIGEPVELMIKRVKNWLLIGITVKIFTARVSTDYDSAIATEYIEKWCLEHIGVVLPITCKKDFQMVQLWDDRCVRVAQNTGIVIAYSHEEE